VVFPLTGPAEEATGSRDDAPACEARVPRENEGPVTAFPFPFPACSRAGCSLDLGVSRLKDMSNSEGRKVMRPGLGGLYGSLDFRQVFLFKTRAPVIEIQTARRLMY
jgi:hypothetical protein